LNAASVAQATSEFQLKVQLKSFGWRDQYRRHPHGLKLRQRGRSFSAARFRNLGAQLNLVSYKFHMSAIYG
jgi:hypothetical protein